MAKYRLTVRHGSKVRRENFDDLDSAIAAMEERARDIRRQGPLEEVSAIRDYEPAQLVHARIQLSAGGRLRGHEAGMDVMGDGTLVPYVGIVRKRQLEPADGESAFDAVRAALA